MSVSIKEKTKNDSSKTADLTIMQKSEIVDKVVELLIAKEKKGWTKRGEKKTEFKKLADKFGISTKTITNNYYKRVLPLMKEEQEKETEKAQRKAKLTVVKNEAPIEIKEEEKQDEQLEIEVNEDSKESSFENQVEETVEMLTGQKEKVEAPIKPTASSVNVTKKISVDDSINDFLYKTEAETKKTTSKFEKDVYGKPLKPPYKHNDIIEVRVDHIRDFGVFCYTCDEYEYKGLIHISEIKDIFVSDPNDYFEVGDIIKVKVLMATHNRLTFSTRDMKLQLKKEKEDIDVGDFTLPKNPPINSLGDKFDKDLQNKLNTIVVEPKPIKEETLIQKEVETILKEDEATIEGDEIEELVTSQLLEEGKVKESEEPTFTNKVNEKDFNDIQNFLNGKIGALSPNAKHKLMELLEDNGMFKSSVIINKVAENFIVDYGMIFMKMVAKELAKDECL